MHANVHAWIGGAWSCASDFDALSAAEPDTHPGAVLDFVGASAVPLWDHMVGAMHLGASVSYSQLLRGDFLTTRSRGRSIMFARANDAGLLWSPTRPIVATCPNACAVGALAVS